VGPSDQELLVELAGWERSRSSSARSSCSDAWPTREDRDCCYAGYVVSMTVTVSFKRQGARLGTTRDYTHRDGTTRVKQNSLHDTNATLRTADPYQDRQRVADPCPRNGSAAVAAPPAHDASVDGHSTQAASRNVSRR
jgi:hypothetical protein